MNNNIVNANWIWESNDFESKNQHVVFLKKFDSPNAKSGKIAISADSDFRLYLNGELIGKEQFPDYPQNKTYSIIHLNNLREKDNELKVEVYYIGEDFSTYGKGQAGLIAVIELGDKYIYSDESWLCAKSMTFKSGEIAKVSLQLSFVIAYDGSKEDAKLNWHHAVIRDCGVQGFCRELTLRKLPDLLNSHKCSAVIIREADIFRADNAWLEHKSFADLVMNDTLVNEREKSNGKLFLGDLGQEEVGDFYLHVRATKNTVIDISHAEHLNSANLIDSKVHDRNFCDRYICKDGENFFVMPYRRLGARYLQLNVTNTQGDFELQDFGVYRREQANMSEVAFVTDSSESDKLRNVALHTLKCCMHHHFEDCPWREQSLYAYDSRNQMLFNYYSFGNYEFVRESLRLLGDGLNRDIGYLNLCAPTNYIITIPIFTMVWAVALHEYFLYSNDVSLLEKYQANLEFIYRKIGQRKDDITKLYKAENNKTIWNFYEWVDDLSNSGDLSDPNHKRDETKIEILFNLYYYEMLVALRKINEVLGNSELIEELNQVCEELAANIETTFWNNEKMCYATSFSHGTFANLYHEHVQVAMLKNNLVPEAKKAGLWSFLQTREAVPVSFSPLVYYIDGMFSLNEESRRVAVEYINSKYKKMLNDGATTFYETEDGAAAFGGAGSLCHAWSSIHIYYYGAKVLGVTPNKDDNKTFEVKPYSCEFKNAQGEVPTAFGNIQIAWQKLDNGAINLQIKHPKELKLTVANYPECPIQKVEIFIIER